MIQSQNKSASDLQYSSLDAAGYQQLLGQAESTNGPSINARRIDTLFEGYVLHQAQDADVVNTKLDVIFEAGLSDEQTNDATKTNNAA